jgi:site-specific DNA recombinase
MSKRAVLYARVSTDEQAEQGYSLPTQIKECGEYAKTNDFTVVGTFSEEYTGTVPIEQRPEGAEAFAMLANGDADALIAYSVDRLVRPPEEDDEWEMVILVRGLAKLGREIHICNRGKLGTSFGEMLVSVLDAKSSGDYRRRMLEQLARGKQGKARAGLYVGTGKPPYGYCRQVDESRKTGMTRRPVVLLVVDEQEARIVVMIFEWYIFGDDSGHPLSFYQIARKLTQMGIMAPGVSRQSARKKTPPEHWRSETVGDIIRNEIYSGIWHYGKRGKPRDQWVPVETPAIIHRSIWEMAQKRVQENSRRGDRHPLNPAPKNHYLMQTRIKCAHCSHILTGATRLVNGRSYSYYSCNGKLIHLGDDWERPKCNLRNIRVDVLDNCVWEWLQTVFERPENLKGLRDRQAEQEQAQNLLRGRLETIEGEIAECRNRLAGLIDLSLESSSDMSKAIFSEKEKELNRCIQKLEREQNTLRSRIADTGISDKSIVTAEALTRNRRKACAEATFDDKRTLIEMLDVRAMVKMLGDGRLLVELSCILPDRALYSIDRLGSVEKQDFAFFGQSGYNRSRSDL